MRDTEDYYSVIINASVSSQSGYDCGYAYITTTRLVPDLYSTDGRIIYISGTKNAMDYTSVPLQGGRIYYLHLIYKKDSSMDVDDDQMVINDISICKTNVEKYRYIVI